MQTRKWATFMKDRIVNISGLQVSSLISVAIIHFTDAAQKQATVSRSDFKETRVEARRGVRRSFP